MTAAAIYARISADPEGRELGVQRQQEDCTLLAARLGLDVVQVYVENDVSASTRTSKARPLFDEMLARAGRGEYGAILAYSNSRLTRRPREFEDLLNLSERRGVRIVTVVSGEDNLSTADGRMVARIKASVDAAEAERTAERVARAKAQAATEGRYRGGRRPFGYEADGVTLRAVEAEALGSATLSVLAGRTLNAIARDLADAGITTTGGGRIDGTALRRLLQRPRNAGLLEAGGEIIGSAVWPAIVSEDIWRGCCAVLADPSRRTSPGPERRWLGSGLIKCSVCGTGLRVHRSPRRDHVYTCPAGKHVARDQEAVDQYLTDAVCALLSRPDVADLLVPDAGDDLGPLRAEVVDLRARLAVFEADYAEGLLTGRQLREATARVQADLSAVEAQIAAHVRASTGIDLGPDPAQAFRDAPLDVRRRVLDLLAAVTIRPGRRGRPKGWRPGDPYTDLTSVDIAWRSASE